jgi:hypothetical protein
MRAYMRVSIFAGLALGLVLGSLWIGFQLGFREQILLTSPGRARLEMVYLKQCDSTYAGTHEGEIDVQIQFYAEAAPYARFLSVITGFPDDVLARSQLWIRDAALYRRQQPYNYGFTEGTMPASMASIRENVNRAVDIVLAYVPEKPRRE